MNEGYINIPNTIKIDKKLSSTSKLVYGEIKSLTNQKGYCWANNTSLAKALGFTPQTISTSIQKLKKNGYIRIDPRVEFGNDRRIYLKEYTVKTVDLSWKNMIPIMKKHEYNNKYNIKYKNTKETISKKEIISSDIGDKYLDLEKEDYFKLVKYCKDEVNNSPDYEVERIFIEDFEKNGMNINQTCLILAHQDFIEDRPRAFKNFTNGKYNPSEYYTYFKEWFTIEYEFKETINTT